MGKSGVKGILLFYLFTFLPLNISAQCGIENTAFKSGEFLSYDLYFNWKFVWVKVGTASMSTVQSRYKGQKAFRSSLVTRGNSQLDNVFMMRDTLLCYTDMDIREPVKATATMSTSCGIAIPRRTVI